MDVKVARMDVVEILRVSYLAAASTVLLIALIPPLRRRFLAYGPRSFNSPPSSAEKEKAAAKKKAKDKASPANASSNLISRTLDDIAGLKVPHDYFWTFYFISCSLSAFWPGEILYLKGPVWQGIAARTHSRGTTMSFEQLKITWAMMLIQGARRLYESITLSTASEFEDNETTSKMGAGHLVLGLLFYLATSVAIWIEGIPTLEIHHLSTRDLIFRAPTLQTLFGVLIFILASGIQHDCHNYLAHLKSSKSEDGKTKEGEYKLPTHPAFNSLVAPHYAAECLIYLSLAIVAAPRGEWVNLTLASALVFVVVNLGVTAGVTRQWYEQRFGAEAVKGKWRMVPFVY